MSKELIERIRNRIHDAPMETEYMLDEAADALEALSHLPDREEVANLIREEIRRAGAFKGARSAADRILSLMERKA